MSDTSGIESPAPEEEPVAVETAETDDSEDGEEFAEYGTDVIASPNPYEHRDDFNGIQDDGSDDDADLG